MVLNLDESCIREIRVVCFRIGGFVVRGEDGVNHVKLVLKLAVLLFELANAREERGFFWICGHFSYCDVLKPMGFALWIDPEGELAWAQGTHEYRPMGTAVIARRGQFHHRDFTPARKVPRRLEKSFAGFYGSLEDLNAWLRSGPAWKPRWTPGHLHHEFRRAGDPIGVPARCYAGVAKNGRARGR